MSEGIENDNDIRTALRWFAQVSGDAAGFSRRLQLAQHTYMRLTEDPSNLGRDLDLGAFGPDMVGSFLAQAKSLLDSRRSYDFALASRCVPWVKQIGVNVGVLGKLPGASDRARRMLLDQSTEPDGALFELAMAGNYAADGENVAFVEEQPGVARTPDLRLFLEDRPDTVAIEFKRLRRGQYEAQERDLQRRIFERAAALIDERCLSLHIDVNYTVELRSIPEAYLVDWLQRFLSSPILTLGHYPWSDEFGSGEIRPANVDAVLKDIRNSSLYFGTKLARLLAGGQVRENNYQLAAGLKSDDRDPRYFEDFRYGSVVTWQCTAPQAIERKARHIKSKLVEAARQVKSESVGVIHLAMDVEIGCESSDLRRQRNKEIILEFRAESPVAALYVHYLVPRISEMHSWIVDETVDRFGIGNDPVPSMMIFPGSAPIDNNLPAWKQSLAVPSPLGSSSSHPHEDS